MKETTEGSLLEVRKILVPMDFSDHSRAALQQAESFARRFEARIDLLHIWEPPEQVRPEVLLHINRDVHRSMTRVARERLRDEMMAFLHDVPDDLAGRVYPRFASGNIVEEILSAATREAVDLIIMGTHGRRGLAHMFVGSVTEKVLRLAPCPVLVVRRLREQQNSGRDAA